MFDMHCHIDLMPSMVEVAEGLNRSNINILTVTTTPKAYQKEIDMFAMFENVKVALGLHPQLVKERYQEISIIERYVEHANYIGEIGLDFSKPFYSSKDKQLDAFETIIRWCSGYGNKTISIHSLRADKAVIDILEKYSCTESNKCILHWFTGSRDQVKRAVEIGCYFSINIKMIESENGRDIISRIPADRILLESDAPFIQDINTNTKLAELLNKTANKLNEYNNLWTLDNANKESARMLRNVSRNKF